MQPETNFQNPHAPHPNYKRVVIGITLVIIALFIVVLAYQYVINKKSANARDVALMNQYQAEQATQTARFLESFNNQVKPATDADKKEIATMINQGMNTSAGDSSAAEMISSQQQQASQLFQEWKASQQ